MTSVASLVILNANGIPLLSRSFGRVRVAPPFAVQGLLSGLFSSLAMQQHQLRTLRTADCWLAFQPAYEALMVVLVLSGDDLAYTQLQLQHLCQSVVDAVVTRIGSQQLASWSPEQLKRALAASAGVFSLILGSETPPLSLVLRSEPLYTALAPDLAKDLLGKLVAVCDGLPDAAALLVGQRTCVALPAWRALSVRDRLAVQLALTSQAGGAVLRDLAVFLPVQSHGNACRLISIAVCQDVEVVALGAAPDVDLGTLVDRVQLYFQPAVPLMRTLQVPGGVAGVTLEPGVLGFALQDARSATLITLVCASARDPGCGVAAQDASLVARALRLATRLPLSTVDGDGDGDAEGYAVASEARVAVVRRAALTLYVAYAASVPQTTLTAYALLILGSAGRLIPQ